MSFQGSQEQLFFDRGRSEWVKGRTPSPIFTDPNQIFWYSRGWYAAEQGTPLDWALVTEVAQTATQRDWYAEGYASGQLVAAGKPAPPARGPVGDPAYGRWINAGVSDGRRGYSARYVITSEPPAPPPPPPNNGGPVVVAPPVGPLPPPPSGYRGPPIFEVVAYVSGKLVPLDRVLSISKFLDSYRSNPFFGALWSALLRFEVLGDAPGEERLGYRLSGPNGPAARWLAWEASRGRTLDPRAYGLPAWFVTRSTGSAGARREIRFLSRSELTNLGIFPEDF